MKKKASTILACVKRWHKLLGIVIDACEDALKLD